MEQKIQLLTVMYQFLLAVQVDIKFSCAILHKFIGHYYEHDLYFTISQIEMQHDSQIGEIEVNNKNLNVHAIVWVRIQEEVVRHAMATGFQRLWKKFYSI
ncbi:hypothetical protein KFK09_015040 [Dendrobium nobile]|uniref:Uncharacterized protein n=1 Tax=Dendrobium nobile TaxID=94219 RepID=A0A8T3B633_DENNO|nr:hypothetical protein KFK09_015040 [Dendrobium nobile]